MDIIYHIVTVQSWQAQIESLEYQHVSLLKEGFIHASKSYQIDGVLERYYKNVNDLLKLSIDVKLLAPTSTVKEEFAESVGEMFPHVFGPINKDAIVEITKIR